MTTGFRKLFLGLTSLVIPMMYFTSCAPSRKGNTAGISNTTPEVQSNRKAAVYNPEPSRSHDLIHTKLFVSFDWEQSALIGTAEITLKPHFYATDKLFLDARGMQLNEVKLKSGDSLTELAYEYRNDSICITFDRMFTRKDTITVYIDYVSLPESLPKGGSAAIMSDKGLYFINARGSDPNKPQQIWTQGETQASSVWFPTIDRPNQKTSQEIYITIDTAFVTLSNGKLLSSIINTSNGTRTDYWSQPLPHAPYLFMMAIGKFSVVTDMWKGKEVSYYVEPQFEPYARNIFAHTPEMLDFFSKITGVDYPWDKYAQVVVRDYVSGAMENTSASLFGEFVQKDRRALMDARNDDIVAHELFHQWFGDLVTCESWANIALNESFATYGEYLWAEYKYGKDEADWTGMNDLNGYLREARNKQVNIVRFDYNRQEEVFDRHSYEKGGRVLHMLRMYTGDEAFFAALKYYLDQNRFGAAEMHHLRLAFEKITGEDMNWFFNQWFFDKGHPSLRIDYEYDEINNRQLVKVQQQQSFETTPLYKLPVDIDIYLPSGVERHRVTLVNQNEGFEFKVPSKPYLVNFDARKMLLCTKTDNHSSEAWINMYRYAPLYLDRYEAVVKLKDFKTGTPEAEIIKQALNDSHWSIRELVIKNCDPLVSAEPEWMKNKLIAMATGDASSEVRSKSLTTLAEKWPADNSVKTIIKSLVKDSSYKVMKAAINYMLESDVSDGLQVIGTLEHDPNENIRSMVSSFYVKHGNDDQFLFMTNALNESSGFSKYTAVQQYGKFLMNCSPENALKGIETISGIGFSHPQWFVRLSASQTLSELSKSYGKSKDKRNDTPAGNTPPALNEREDFEKEKVRKKAESRLSEIKLQERDPNLIKIYNK